MTVAFVLKGYPRLSETFIAQEIRALEGRGLDILIVSLRHPTGAKRHPIHDEIAARVIYLPEYLYQEPLRVLRAWWAVRALPKYRRAFRTWWRDLRRDRTANRIRRFGQALVLAHELPPSCRHLHAHFLHTPASVTRYAATILGLPWTCSAHAKDIWTIPEWEKREKLADCRWLVTCTGVNARHLEELTSERGRVELLYHGIDFARFPPAPPRSRRDGSSADAPVVVLSVGRVVEKKGYPDLLRALAALGDLHWRFVHVGGGEMSKQLRMLAHRLGIAARVQWLGALSQTEVLTRYREADLFVLPSRIADSGDRDGLPNVFMEAQSQALCCLGTSVSAIPELIIDGQTGLLAPPDDPAALTGALARLIRDPDLRLRLGKAGEARVRSRFGFGAGIDRLAEKFAIGNAAVRRERASA